MSVQACEASEGLRARTPEAKIALFRSLFRGREDVYARRFESGKTGKSGYAPACANEWVTGLCEKPRVKCADCPHRSFLPVTDAVIRRHLCGLDDGGREFVMGIYPMLLDESCFFLAADFDKSHWRDDAQAFLDTCRQSDLPAAVERSRSGNGAHIWLFFSEAVPATLARRLGAHILTETMERRPELGLDSYDRFFPNQDTLPRGGFGNLIALPLQKQSRRHGNTVFLDERFEPLADQWAFLSGIRRITHCEVEQRVRDAEGRGCVVGVRLAFPNNKDATPWTAPSSRRHRTEIPDTQLPETLDELRVDEPRNQLICDDVLRAVKAGRSPVVLTERTEHIERLAAQLSPHVRHLIVLRGGLRKKALKEIRIRLASIPDAEERVLLATGRYIGEGFDDSRLDTLFLTLPVSWRGTIAQYVGRLHRLHDRKREVLVYDYADLNVPMLARMFDRRCRSYEAVGYTLELPASAVPGWPSDVPLPVDPAWKKDYAGTVQRLIRDGVDSRVANLFAHVTRTVHPDAKGQDRARSATEAFLYGRLETLSETAGCFRLNAQLPIAFDGWGKMEVDLVCSTAKVVVELDGAQHLGDADAYRRDRRKDLLLQENGYVVLRFLAEDVGAKLDAILDAILRTLANRQRHSSLNPTISWINSVARR